MVQLTVTPSDIIHCDEANDRTPGEENAHLVSLRRIPKYPSAAKHLSFKGYLYTWPEKKSNTLWREGDRKERKRGGKGRGLLSEPQMPPSAHFNKPKGCVLGIPRGGKKNNRTAFLSFSWLLSPLLHRPSPAKWQTAAPSSAESCVLCPGDQKIGRWNEHRRTAQGGSRQETGGLQSTFSAGLQATRYRGEHPSPCYKMLQKQTAEDGGP